MLTKIKKMVSRVKGGDGGAGNKTRMSSTSSSGVTGGNESPLPQDAPQGYEEDHGTVVRFRADGSLQKTMSLPYNMSIRADFEVDDAILYAVKERACRLVCSLHPSLKKRVAHERIDVHMFPPVAQTPDSEGTPPPSEGCESASPSPPASGKPHPRCLVLHAIDRADRYPKPLSDNVEVFHVHHPQGRQGAPTSLGLRLLHRWVRGGDGSLISWVEVVQVEPNSPAGKAGVSRGKLIRLNYMDIHCVEDAMEALQNVHLSEEEGEAVLEVAQFEGDSVIHRIPPNDPTGNIGSCFKVFRTGIYTAVSKPGSPSDLAGVKPFGRVITINGVDPFYAKIPSDVSWSRHFASLLKAAKEKGEVLLCVEYLKGSGPGSSTDRSSDQLMEWEIARAIADSGFDTAARRAVRELYCERRNLWWDRLRVASPDSLSDAVTDGEVSSFFAEAAVWYFAERVGAGLPQEEEEDKEKVKLREAQPEPLPHPSAYPMPLQEYDAATYDLMVSVFTGVFSTAEPRHGGRDRLLKVL
eukprot:TRINITY_DN3829_c4_g1_i1.p1 TRINITY_DN3829_c4_g1~~TRINITY_DN3829_c4_g1_i1.p1  ORF type:complete len:524 (+),score=118.63 TRINITY_DN3829_c4_g1_i1:271-1842(+)